MPTHRPWRGHVPRPRAIRTLCTAAIVGLGCLSEQIVALPHHTDDAVEAIGITIDPRSLWVGPAVSQDGNTIVYGTRAYTEGYADLRITLTVVDAKSPHTSRQIVVPADADPDVGDIIVLSQAKALLIPGLLTYVYLQDNAPSLRLSSPSSGQCYVRAFLVSLDEQQLVALCDVADVSKKTVIALWDLTSIAKPPIEVALPTFPRPDVAATSFGELPDRRGFRLLRTIKDKFAEDSPSQTYLTDIDKLGTTATTQQVALPTTNELHLSDLNPTNPDQLFARTVQFGGTGTSIALYHLSDLKNPQFQIDLSKSPKSIFGYSHYGNLQAGLFSRDGRFVAVDAIIYPVDPSANFRYQQTIIFDTQSGHRVLQAEGQFWSFEAQENRFSALGWQRDPKWLDVPSYDIYRWAWGQSTSSGL